MEDELIITLKNLNAEIDRVNELVGKFAEKNGISDKATFDLHLILEEFLTNIIKYGYGDKAEHTITVKIALTDGAISASIEDDGIPFNPLDAPEPDVHESLETRRIGGLGIFLVRKLTDVIAYERKDDKNIISFIKKIS